MASSTDVFSDRNDVLGTARDGCASSAGSYFLSKSHIKVTVTGTRAEPKLDKIEIIPVADRANGYCLDYLAAATSKDTFVVQKNADNLLLKITSSAEDRSAEIAKKIVQTVFKGLEAAAGFRADEGDPRLSGVAFEAEYDPFNIDQANLINDGLADFGFCLVLDTVLDRMNARSVSAYCNDPLNHGGRTQALIHAASYANDGDRGANPRFYDARGVLYRPRLPHSLNLFRYDQGRWRLWQSETVFLENDSPILSVGIDRTYFATRKTTLVFTQGVLHDVLISKGSELENFVEVPLEIANGIVKLPSQIVKLQVDTTTRRADLIAAQARLLEEERALAESRKQLKTAQGQKPDGAPQDQDRQRSFRRSHRRDEWHGRRRRGRGCRQVLSRAPRVPERRSAAGDVPQPESLPVRRPAGEQRVGTVKADRHRMSLCIMRAGAVAAIALIVALLGVQGASAQDALPGTIPRKEFRKIEDELARNYGRDTPEYRARLDAAFRSLSGARAIDAQERARARSGARSAARSPTPGRAIEQSGTDIDPTHPFYSDPRFAKIQDDVRTQALDRGRAEARIIRGRPTDQNGVDQFPATVAITRPNASDHVHCSGTIVGPRAVLTAMHCACVNGGPRRLSGGHVVLGRTLSGGQRIRIAGVKRYGRSWLGDEGRRHCTSVPGQVCVDDGGRRRCQRAWCGVDAVGIRLRADRTRNQGRQAYCRDSGGVAVLRLGGGQGALWLRAFQRHGAQRPDWPRQL